MTALTQRIPITFSIEPSYDDAVRTKTIDLAPFLTYLVESNMAYAGQWVGALLSAEEDPCAFMGEVDFDDLAEWAKYREPELYGFLSEIRGMNAMLPPATERYNALPKAVDAVALRMFALSSLSTAALARVNELIQFDPIGSEQTARHRSIERHIP